ncbi:sodium/proline symporter PutP [Alteromonas oceanisediminis]|uniref:sodium/proline symporter PutP n=1 Tax=Alteromonas oceanisediminis TaxID=2836180 RepID=UPI001BDB4A93|nr:sodium/proline symporter PutP [Alteromonas oceanisediminis]MBT0587511.1 sodium/proline symporter PutP [Alteromonas oceanisediminis]
MQTGTLVSLGIYFLAMLAIGLWAYRKNEVSVEGYMLGGRQLSPSVTALSAGASDMSGWMLMGLPGAMYVSGLSASWIAFGLTLGAFLNYLLVAPRLRAYTEVANNSITLPDYFENRFNDKSRILRIVASIVIVIFFTLYTSSGLVAGGKLFESSFGYSYEWGLYITAGVVVAYTLVGGFMAVSVTDFVQGCIMFIALVMVPTTVIFELGGITQSLELVTSQSPNALALWIDAATNEPLTFIGIVSLMSWGLGYFGQPHIIVRFMAIRSLKDIPTARRIGMSWMIVSLIGALGTGLFGAALVNSTDLTLADPETVFIYLSQILFNPLIGGFLLAAILAAIMSTISSQLLVTSSSLANDLYHSFFNRSASQAHLVIAGRVAVITVAVVAIMLAFDRTSTILSLVSNAWAGFGAAFGPLILFSLFNANMSRAAAIAGMVSGTVTVLFWIYAPITIGGQTLGAIMYEIVPGFTVSTLTILAFIKAAPTHDPHIANTHRVFEEKLLRDME